MSQEKLLHDGYKPDDFACHVTHSEDKKQLNIKKTAQIIQQIV